MDPSDSKLTNPTPGGFLGYDDPGVVTRDFLGFMLIPAGWEEPFQEVFWDR